MDLKCMLIFNKFAIVVYYLGLTVQHTVHKSLYRMWSIRFSQFQWLWSGS